MTKNIPGTKTSTCQYISLITLCNNFHHQPTGYWFHSNEMGEKGRGKERRRNSSIENIVDFKILSFGYAWAHDCVGRGK